MVSSKVTYSRVLADPCRDHYSLMVKGERLVVWAGEVRPSISMKAVY